MNIFHSIIVVLASFLYSYINPLPCSLLQWGFGKYALVSICVSLVCKYPSWNMLGRWTCIHNPVEK